MKICTNKDCQTPVEKQRFYFDKAKSHHAARCMDCIREAARGYYYKNRAKILERSQTIRDTRLAMRTL